MIWAYPAALLASIAGIAALDARFKLFVWRAPVRAALTLASGLAFFVAWDLAGIRLGIFRHVDSAYASGLLVAPQLPVEELAFLLFLCHLSMVALFGARRLLAAAHRRRAGGAPHREGGRA